MYKLVVTAIGVMVVTCTTCRAPAEDAGDSQPGIPARYPEAEVKLLRSQVESLKRRAESHQKELVALRQENAVLKGQIAQLRILVAKGGAVPSSQPASLATYFLIPVKGVIGRDFTSEKMKRYLEQAALLAPTVVVLEIDTLGGGISDAEEIVDLIGGYKGIRSVALVRKALSAGAAITLACKEIYVTDGAMIGAAVSYSVDRRGRVSRLPADVAEKFQSAWRAVCRKAAQYGGHPAILAEAMADPDFALTMRTKSGHVVLERNGRGKALKARGKILTLTAVESLECGLAKGRARSIEALGQAIGLTAWRKAPEPVGSVRPSRADASLRGVTPGRLLEALTAKVEEMRLSNDSLTVYQKKAGFKALNEWFRKHRFIGSRVCWLVNIAEVTDDNSRSRRIEGLEREVARAQSRLQSAKARLSAARRVSTGGLFGTSPKGKQEGIRRAREGVSQATAQLMKLAPQLREAKEFPILVRATSSDTHVMPIEIWVNKANEPGLLKLAAGDTATFRGIVRDARGVVRPDGGINLEVTLDKCVLVRPKQ